MLPPHLFTRLSLDGAYKRMLDVLLDRPDLFFLLSTLVLLPLLPLVVTCVGAVNRALTDHSIDPSHPLAFYKHVWKVMMVVLLEGLLTISVTVIGQAAMCHAVLEMYLHKQPDWIVCLQRGWSKRCHIVGAVFLAFLGLYIGQFGATVVVVAVCFTFGKIGLDILATESFFFTVLLFMSLAVTTLAGIYIMISLLIVTPVVMVEGRGPVASLQRCFALAQGSRCYIYSTLVVLFVFKFVVESLVYSLFMDEKNDRFSTYGAVVSTLPSVLFIPMGVILQTIVYLNLRMEKEGLNRDVLERELGFLGSSLEGGAGRPEMDASLLVDGGVEVPRTGSYLPVSTMQPEMTELA